MQILIIGAGRVGCAVAETLVAEANDITVVDSDRLRVENLQSRLDLRGVVGNALSPQVLTSAGAQDADIILAVTANDETNMSVCLLASRLFNIPTRIARVRNSELRNYTRLLAEEGFQITSSIWPEQALTESLMRLIEFPEALQIQTFGDGKAALFCVRAMAGSPLVGRTVRELSVHLPTVPVRIVAVFRRNRRLDLSGDTVIESGDEVIALSQGRDIRRVITEFRHHEERIRRVIIGANTTLALQLAEALNGPEGRKGYQISIVDPNLDKDLNCPTDLPKDTNLFHGSITDEEMLTSLGIEQCDTFLALGAHDETNIMGALLAKKLGARRVIALTDNTTFSDLMQGTQIDITVSSTQATLGELLRHVRHGDVVAAHSLRRGVAEALEIVAHGNKKSSRVVGKRIGALSLPAGTSVAAILREDENSGESNLIIASRDLVIESEDHVIVFVPNKRLIPQVEELFAVDVGFF